MDLDRVSTQTIINQRGQNQNEAYLQGRGLVIARVAWVVVLVLAVGLFIASIPFTFADAHIICTPANCGNNSNLTLDQVHELQHLGLSLDFYAALFVAWSSVLELVYVVTGMVIFWRKSADRMAILSSLALIMFGAAFRGFNPEASLSPLLSFASLGTAFLGNCSMGFFFYLFPTGRFDRRWMGWLALGWIIYWGINNLVLATILTNSGADFVIFMGLLVSVIITQVYRYRRVSTPEQRRQTRWVVFGISLALLGFITLLMIASIVSLDIIPTLILGSLLYVFLLLIPFSIGIAILRTHLWDIDILINRTLVYGLLTVCVIALYVLVVVGLGALFQVNNNLLLSLLATGLIAVLFQPLRERLQRAVNRLMYGERDDPYKVISRLGQRLEATLAPETVLPTIVETVAQTLKLPYVAITLKKENELVAAAAYGEPKEKPASLPLIYQGEQIGELVLASRGSSEPLSSADRQLLNDLACQAGIAAHAVLLTADLQRLTNDLQQSRQRLVTAREEERRRLRRDLHDELGPTLATITLQAEAARDIFPMEPAQAAALLDDLIKQAQTAIGDVRRLVYDLRPPALDDLGLVAAVRAQIARYEHHELRIAIDAPPTLPQLPAAVEVAAYRIIQEALTNVVRHADARSCSIQLTCDSALHLVIQDDGHGLPARYQPGVGLRSMHERTTELGGSLSVETLREGGVCINATLPCVALEGHSLAKATEATETNVAPTPAIEP